MQKYGTYIGSSVVESYRKVISLVGSLVRDVDKNIEGS